MNPQEIRNIEELDKLLKAEMEIRSICTRIWSIVGRMESREGQSKLLHDFKDGKCPTCGTVKEAKETND